MITEHEFRYAQDPAEAARERTTVMLRCPVCGALDEVERGASLACWTQAHRPSLVPVVMREVRP